MINQTGIKYFKIKEVVGKVIMPKKVCALSKKTPNKVPNKMVRICGQRQRSVKNSISQIAITNTIAGQTKEYLAPNTQHHHCI